MRLRDHLITAAVGGGGFVGAVLLWWWSGQTDAIVGMTVLARLLAGCRAARIAGVPGLLFVAAAAGRPLAPEQSSSFSANSWRLSS